MAVYEGRVIAKTTQNCVTLTTWEIQLILLGTVPKYLDATRALILTKYRLSFTQDMICSNFRPKFTDTTLCHHIKTSFLLCLNLLLITLYHN